MGAWGGLCVFDYARYIQEVVPAFQSGEQHPLIQNTLALKQREHPQRPISAFQGLAQLGAYCDPLMTTCSLGRAFSVCDGGLIATPQSGQPCADRWGYEDVADLFERVLTRYTITHYTILGLTFTAVRQVFPPELDDVTRSLIDALDDRCHYWAPGTGGYGEGIRGWLDPEETELLELELAAFSSAAPAWPPARIQRLFVACYESEEEYARHMGRITQFMTILGRARAVGHGVLWGRDLRLFYKDGGLFSAEEPRPMEL
jgi:hypothetical protein